MRSSQNLLIYRLAISTVSASVFHPSDHFCSPPVDLLKQVHVFLVLENPELDVVLQVGPHQSGVEGESHLPWPADHTSMQPTAPKSPQLTQYKY